MTADAFDIRRRRFGELLKTFSVASVCEALDVTPGYVSHMKTGRKGIGGDYARKIEKALGLSKYWLDGELATGADREAKASYHGVMLTRAGALLAAEWEKLDVADRAEIEGEIYARVAKKVRGARHAPAPGRPQSKTQG